MVLTFNSGPERLGLMIDPGLRLDLVLLESYDDIM